MLNIRICFDAGYLCEKPHIVYLRKTLKEIIKIYSSENALINTAL